MRTRPLLPPPRSSAAVAIPSRSRRRHRSRPRVHRPLQRQGPGRLAGQHRHEAARDAGRRRSSTNSTASDTETAIEELDGEGRRDPLRRQGRREPADGQGLRQLRAAGRLEDREEAATAASTSAASRRCRSGTRTTSPRGSKADAGKGTGSGGLWNNPAGDKAKMPLKKADKPVGEWNTFHITMVGDKVTVKLNGELVVDKGKLPTYKSIQRQAARQGPDRTADSTAIRSGSRTSTSRNCRETCRQTPRSESGRRCLPATC